MPYRLQQGLERGKGAQGGKSPWGHVLAVQGALGAMSSTEDLVGRRGGVRANEHGSENIEALGQENLQRSLYQKLYDDTQYVHSEGAKYPGYCEPQQVKYADCRDSRAGKLDPRKHNDWLGGVRDGSEISRYGLDSYLPNSTRSHQGPAWDMPQSMVFREGYWGASHSCLDLQFVDEQPRGKEHYSYQSFGRAGGLGHTNAVPFSNIMEGEQNLNQLPFGPGGDRHLSGGPAYPDNRDAHQALGSFHPPPSFQDDRLDAVRLRSNSGDNMSGTWSLVGKHQLRYPSREKEPMSLIEAHACSESQLAYDPKGIPPTRDGGSQCR